MNLIIDGLMPGSRGDILPGLLEAAVARTLRFDLAPEELIEQQLAGVVILDARRSLSGTAATERPLLYRDHPDGDPRDNLLSMPHYTPAYQSPA